MKLRMRSLETENFGLRKDCTKLVFGDDNTKNVTIVQVKNDAVKSTVLNAITWCLYGAPANSQTDTRKNNIPIINTSALNDSPDGESTFARVRIILEIDDTFYTVERSLEAKKTGTQISYSAPVFRVYEACGDCNTTGDYNKNRIGNNTNPLEGKAASEFIEEVIPEAFGKLIFTDVWRLKRSSYNNAPDKIEDAIDRLFNLDKIRSVIKSLNAYTTGMETEYESNNPRVNEIRSDINKSKKAIAYYDIKIRELNSLLRNAEESYEKARRYLETNSDRELKTLLKKREAKKELKKDFDEQLAKKIRERNAYLAYIAPFIYLKDIIEDAYYILINKEERAELPATFFEDFIDGLLNDGVCICGHIIGDEERRNMIEYAKNIRINYSNDFVNRGQAELLACLDRISEFGEEISRYDDAVNLSVSKSEDAATAIEEIEERIEEIYKEMKEFDEDKIKEMNDLYKSSYDAIVSCNNEIKMHEQSKSYFEKKKDKLYSSLDDLFRVQRVQRAVYGKFKMANSALDCLNRVDSEVCLRVRAGLEKYTEDAFLSSVENKGVFAGVGVDERYNVSVKYRDGYDASMGLSEDESLLLDVSFMSALMSLSGCFLPAIVSEECGVGGVEL